MFGNSSSSVPHNVTKSYWTLLMFHFAYLLQTWPVFIFIIFWGAVISLVDKVTRLYSGGFECTERTEPEDYPRWQFFHGKKDVFLWENLRDFDRMVLAKTLCSTWKSSGSPLISINLQSPESLMGPPTEGPRTEEEGERTEEVGGEAGHWGEAEHT